MADVITLAFSLVQLIANPNVLGIAWLHVMPYVSIPHAKFILIWNGIQDVQRR